MGEVIFQRFKYTEEEYAAAVRRYLIHKTDFRRRFIPHALIFALFLSFCIARSDFVVPFFLILFGVAWLFLWTLELFIMPRRRFRRYPKFQEEYLLQFSDDGIQVQT